MPYSLKLSKFVITDVHFFFFTPFEIQDGFDYSRSFEDKIDYLERSNFIRDFWITSRFFNFVAQEIMKLCYHQDSYTRRYVGCIQSAISDPSLLVIRVLL